MDRRTQLVTACRALGVESLYLFGSRADEGLRVLGGATAQPGGSDLDAGVFFGATDVPVDNVADLQVALEDVFAPLKVDLVILDRLDALFQYRAIDGHRVFVRDSARTDRAELTIMRRAAELLPILRALERARFGVSTS